MIKNILLIPFMIIGGLLSTKAVTVTISAGGPTTFCVGKSVLLSGAVNPPGNYLYQWLKNSANATPSGKNINFTATTSGYYKLRVTDTVASTVDYSDSILVTVNPLPTKPGIHFNSPAILCGGNPIQLTDTVSSSNVVFQWILNTIPISGATDTGYTAQVAGTYRLMVTDTMTTCRDTSVNITVGQLPSISGDTLRICGDDTTISVGGGSVSFSVLPVECNALMSKATLVTGSSGGGGGVTRIICTGGSVISSGTGSAKYLVEYGGSLSGFGGGGANTAWVKAGGAFTSTGGGGNNKIYYEQGAIVNAGTYATIACPVIGIIYPENSAPPCDNIRYLWSTGDTTATITVKTSKQMVYYVTISNGTASCMDSVVVIPDPLVNLDTIGTYVDITRAPITLTATPPGGTFSGPGVTGNSFDPSIAGLDATIVYTFTSSFGCTGSDSMTVIVVDSIALSTNEVTRNNNLKIYPHPAKTNVTVEYGDYATMTGYKMSIVNSIGQIFFSEAITQKKSSIDLSSFSKGIYFVNIFDRANAVVNSRKLVLQ